MSSERQACESLMRAAIERRVAFPNIRERYHCDPLPERSAFFVIGLRYRASPDQVGSSLIGWFGVSKLDRRVLPWDINEDQPAPVIPGYTIGAD